MKILLLMPLDERFAHMAIKIYSALPHEVKDKTVCMPAFMDYLVTTEFCKNWTYALFDTLLTTGHLCETEEDIIVIGNVSKKYKFDAIFNFQDIEEDLPYKDVFVEKIQEIVKDEKVLEKYISDLYTAEDSKMSLHNCIATADFLAAYSQTDPHLDKIKEEYEEKIGKYGGSNGILH